MVFRLLWVGVMSNFAFFSGCFKRALCSASAVLLSACSLVAYQPTKTIDHVRENEGYRLEQSIQRSNQDNTLVIMMFSGGGVGLWRADGV